MISGRELDELASAAWLAGLNWPEAATLLLNRGQAQPYAVARFMHSFGHCERRERELDIKPVGIGWDKRHA